MTKIHPDLRQRANRFSEEVFPALRRTGSGSGSGSGSSQAAPLPDGDGGSMGGEGINGGSGGGERRRQQTVSNGVPNSGGGVAGEGWGNGEGLVGAGLGDVQLAWDFVTASEGGQLGVLRAMRETSRGWLDAALPGEWAAPAAPEPVPPRRLRDLGAVEGDVEVGTASKNGRDRGGGGGGGGVGGESSPARSSSGDERGSSDGNGDSGLEHRRRTASDTGQLPPAVPLYRVVKVEQAPEYGNDGGGDDDPNYTSEHSAIARTVWGRMRVPAFVSPSTRGTGLVGGWETADSGDSGTAQPQPQRSQATLEAGFVVRVPRCVATGKKRPSALIQYGHGLFGDRSEMEDGFLDVMAERGAWILVAADWRGMSRIDLTVVARALVSQPELLFSGTPEDLMQVQILYARVFC